MTCNATRYIVWDKEKRCAQNVEITDYHYGMTGFNRRKNMRKNNLIHPGEILREEFMIPMKISQNRLALAIGVPATRVGEIVNERRAITVDTAIRLGTYFKTGPEFWINLQTNYDLGIAYNEKKHEYDLIRM